MNARKKLNSAYIGGSALMAAAFGGMTESWLVFVMLLVLLLAFHIYQRDIRPDPGPKPNHKI